MVSIDYLDEERKKLWQEILELRKELEKKSSDYEKEAKQASKKASEFRNRSYEANNAITELLERSNQVFAELADRHQQIDGIADRLIGASKEAERYIISVDQLEKKHALVEELFENRDALGEKLAKLEEISQSGEQSFSKINAAYNGLLKRKSELDEIYYEIVGYEEDVEGSDEKLKVAGLKDELDQAYERLQMGAESLKGELTEIRENALRSFNNDTETREKSFRAAIADWKSEYAALSSEVKKLLPDALTAGLSFAFSEKRKAEILEGYKASKTFNWAIIGLVIVSIIPFAINVYLIQQGRSLESVIADMPRIVTSILPLYIPFLWLAYSSNKRINLSKRLVEEYTHKEVLSKTYEGLSSQIESIRDSDMSSELRIKLLSNILDVSSENPGKLISDYNKSDHPLMDALEKSSKLTEAVDNLSKIPGLKKLVTFLDKKSDEILARETKKIDTSLDAFIDSKTASDERSSKMASSETV
jgi:chromosome segregation ATPase